MEKSNVKEKSNQNSLFYKGIETKFSNKLKSIYTEIRNDQCLSAPLDHLESAE